MTERVRSDGTAVFANTALALAGLALVITLALAFEIVGSSPSSSNRVGSCARHNSQLR